MALRVGVVGRGRIARRHLLALATSLRDRAATLAHQAALWARGRAIPDTLVDG